MKVTGNIYRIEVHIVDGDSIYGEPVTFCGKKMYSGNTVELEEAVTLREGHDLNLYCRARSADEADAGFYVYYGPCVICRDQAEPEIKKQALKDLAATEL